MSNWTTRLDPEITRQFGVEEAHDAYFEPAVWGEQRPVVALLIPECELQFIQLTNGEPITFMNRPVHNKKIKYWLRFACELATEHMAFITICCNTAEDTERAAKRAAKLLPKHQRVAAERMYQPSSRERANLS